MAQETSQAQSVLVWTWELNLGNTSTYFMACLTDSALLVKESIFTESGRESLIKAIREGQDPAAVMKAKKIIPLGQIREIRVSDEAGVLEVHGLEKRKIKILSAKQTAHREIFEAIRKKLAPTAQVTPGKLSSGSDTSVPVLGLILTVFIGGVMSIWASNASADPHNTGRRAGLKNLIESFLATIGVGGTVALTLFIAAIFGAWLFYRMKNPKAADVIKIV